MLLQLALDLAHAAYGRALRVLADVDGGTAALQQVPALVEAPAELAGIAEIFCGQSDPDAEFELGLDLMLRGVDSLTLRTRRDLM